MKISNLSNKECYDKYGNDIYYLFIAKYNDEKFIDNVELNDEEMNYLSLFLKNIEKGPRLGIDIENFIKIIKEVNILPDFHIHLSDSDKEELMKSLCYKYNRHFDLRCDLLAFIKGYYYNRGYLSGISNLINALYEDYLKKIEKDKKNILAATKEYNPKFQKELINMYLYECYSVKSIINNLPSKEIVNEDYNAIGNEEITPMCVSLFKSFLSGNIDEYENVLGKYEFDKNKSIPITYTKDDFLGSIYLNKQKLLYK